MPKNQKGELKMETICVVTSVLLYWAVILSGAATLTAGLFKVIDIIERPARKHRGKGEHICRPM